MDKQGKSEEKRSPEGEKDHDKGVHAMVQGCCLSKVNLSPSHANATDSGRPNWSAASR